MAPLLAFCVFDPLVAASISEQHKHSASVSQFFFHQFLRDWAPHNLQCVRMITLHLIFTSNDGNKCVTRAGMSLLLQPYFGGRFPLISSLFPLLFFLKFVFVRPRSSRFHQIFPAVLTFCWLLLLSAKGIWN
jgi:hypothetical protein